MQPITDDSWLEELNVLPALSTAELHACWERLEGTKPPNISTGLLRLLYAQRTREHAYGGIPAWVLAEFDRVLVESRKPRENKRVDSVRRSLSVGTRLVREWNGKTISVEVREEGYLYADKLYGSLSEIARVVTGAHWSGPRFFGMKRRG
ncbi:hypothetical protein GGR91_001966 [Sphingorhabdus rigui]|uniref:DUF2924 domain-containing protein n=1 Tax=Sphingorhabdus rigui TaxID=1282858 RepID=A0A840B037_9SPHN|nr:DUF2924 domain-containing protein [Sphingorhabdus rigui]MBB3943708.1 hypothetical protein [Sphingorhabdus rigui]